MLVALPAHYFLLTASRLTLLLADGLRFQHALSCRMAISHTGEATYDMAIISISMLHFQIFMLRAFVVNIIIHD